MSKAKRNMIRATHPLRGLCYVMTEMLFHYSSVVERDFRPHRATHKGISHWWLQNARGDVIDLTSDQFLVPFPYHKGKPAGFLTKTPSKRTIKLILALDEVRYRR